MPATLSTFMPATMSTIMLTSLNRLERHKRRKFSSHTTFLAEILTVRVSRSRQVPQLPCMPTSRWEASGEPDLSRRGFGSHRAYDRSWCRLSGGAGSTELQCQGQVKRACSYLEPGFWFKVAPSDFLRLIREMRCKLVELFLCNDILVRVHGPTYVRGRGLYLSRKLTFSWSCFWPFNF